MTTLFLIRILCKPTTSVCIQTAEREEPNHMFPLFSMMVLSSHSFWLHFAFDCSSHTKIVPYRSDWSSHCTAIPAWLERWTNPPWATACGHWESTVRVGNDQQQGAFLYLNPLHMLLASSLGQQTSVVQRSFNMKMLTDKLRRDR